MYAETWLVYDAVALIAETVPYKQVFPPYEYLPLKSHFDRYMLDDIKHDLNNDSIEK